MSAMGHSARLCGPIILQIFVGGVTAFAQTTVQVPIDEAGFPVPFNAQINGVEYALRLNGEPGAIMEVTSPDAPPARWPSMIPIDLSTLGLAAVNEIRLGTFTSFAADLPTGLPVARLVCRYAEGGPPTTLSMRLGVHTAEWSIERIEHVENLGGVPHAAPPILFSWLTMLDSREPYEGHSYAGSLPLDRSRTLSCIELELAAGSPFPGLRHPSVREPWLAQTVSAITLIGPPGVPATISAGCGGAVGPIPAGFVQAQIHHRGAEHLVAGAEVDPDVSARTPEGYAPVEVALSGDGRKAWFILFDAFPNVEGDPRNQLWVVNTDGTGAMRSGIADANIANGTLHIATNHDGSQAIVESQGTGDFFRARPGLPLEPLYNSLALNAGCARGAMRLSDDGGRFMYSSFCDPVGVYLVDLATDAITPDLIAPRTAFVDAGFVARRMRPELDISRDAVTWTVLPEILNTAQNRLNLPIVVGTGFAAPTLQNQQRPIDDREPFGLNLADDGSIVGYCLSDGPFGESDPCFVQSVGSSTRQEIRDDDSSGLADFRVSDNGSRLYARTNAGFGTNAAHPGFLMDLDSGERHMSGSPRFADGLAASFTNAELSDNGRLLSSAVSRGVYVLHDGRDNLAGFPAIDRVIYQYDVSSDEVVIRVDVTAPTGVERINLYPLYLGLEPARAVPTEVNPFFRIRFGGADFTNVGNGVWETRFKLDGKRAFVDASYRLRVVLVDGNASRTVFQDFSLDCLDPSCVPRAMGDTDGDALPDDWEINGVDIDSDGVVDLDLPAMGADPFHKDIFVEIDYMVAFGFLGHSHKPKAPALRALIEAFDQAPVSNPDGTTGIRLHIDAGPDTVMDPVTGARWGAMSEADALPHSTTLGDGSPSGGFSWSAFDAIKAGRFSPARRAAFHYCIFAHDLGGLGSTSGIARGIPSSDLIVSLGSWPGQVGTVPQQAGTLMHELGHNLGLRHGGDNNENYKPNYLSVMNYSFQTRGLRIRGTDGHFDFSRFVLPPLLESALNETIGLLGVSEAAGYGTRYFDLQGVLQLVNAVNGSIDWNGDGFALDSPVAVDINGSAELELLTGSDDWERIVFDGGGIGSLGAGGGLPDTSESNDITCEEDREIPDELSVSATGPGFVELPAGATTRLTYRVRNASSTNESFSIAVDAQQTWVDTSGVPASVTLTPGESTMFSLPYDVPPGTLPGVGDLVVFTVMSERNPLIVDAVETTTIVVDRTTPALISIMDGMGGINAANGQADTFISPLGEDVPFESFTLETDMSLASLTALNTVYTETDPAPIVRDFTDQGRGRSIVQLDRPIATGHWLKLTLEVTGVPLPGEADTIAPAIFEIWLAHQPLDVNQDTSTNIRDATAFGDEFRGAGRAALVDINGDGTTNIRDATAFGNMWFGRGGATRPWRGSELPPKPE